MSTTAVSVTKPKKRRYTVADVLLWKSYLDEGMPYKAVAEIVGVQRHTIMRHLPGRGMPMDEARKLGTFVRQHNRKMKKLALKSDVLE